VTRCVLVTGAGGGGANNLIRSIHRSGYPVRIVGANAEKYALAQSLAEKNYLLPRGDAGERYLNAMKRVIEAENVDLLIPNNDTEVAAVSKCQDQLLVRTFLPASGVVEMCQDKLALMEHLARQGFRVATTFLLKESGEANEVFRRLNNPEKLWCRLRRGSGSRGSLPVNEPSQVEFWVRYWQQMRGIGPEMFLLCEYLPGRDYAFQSLWRNGELIIAKTCERVDYIFGVNMPAGTSSSPRVGKLVNNPHVNDICEQAVKSIDGNATGMFCIDLKEDKDGVPCITEINIGRFFMITIVFNTTGTFNMAELYLRLAFGEDIVVPAQCRFGDIGRSETWLVREVDNEPTVLTKEQLEGRFINLSE
jgi:glutathione synthase/RimK-type ligase-like ATP-grasp enzyme